MKVRTNPINQIQIVGDYQKLMMVLPSHFQYTPLHANKCHAISVHPNKPQSPQAPPLNPILIPFIHYTIPFKSHWITDPVKAGFFYGILMGFESLITLW